MLSANLTAKPEKIVPSQVIGFSGPLTSKQFGSKDAVLYALSLGYSADPVCPNDLHFTYELDDEFRTVPSVATVITSLDFFEMLVACPGIPDMDPMRILHGEQRVELLREIRDNVTFYSKTTLHDVQDKGKNAIIVFRTVTSTRQDLAEPTCLNYTSLVLRGLGGFDPNRKPAANLFALPPMPEGGRVVLRQRTDPRQALFYRLNGDYNPLHVDPNLAAAGGFDRPILHGLCTFGVTTKQLMAHFCNNDPRLVHRIVARFVGHVFPGENLLITAARQGSTVVVSVTTEERGKEVLQGYIEIGPNAEPKL